MSGNVLYMYPEGDLAATSAALRSCLSDIRPEGIMHIGVPIFTGTNPDYDGYRDEVKETIAIDGCDRLIKTNQPVWGADEWVMSITKIALSQGATIEIRHASGVSEAIS